MAKFRSKPSTLIAEQWFPGKNTPGVQYFPKIGGMQEACFVETLHGHRIWLAPGDWVAQEPDGIHYYPIKPEVFEKLWEPIPENENT